MTDYDARPSSSKLPRIKPGAVLRAAGYGGPPVMPNFSDEDDASSIATSTKRERPNNAGASSRTDAKTAEPTVTVERDGARVTRIVAKCKCGEQIDIDCSYSQPANNAT